MSKRILVIEDNTDINTMLINALSNADYQAHAAYTGIDGFNKLQHTQYDLILLDIMLPDKNGDELLKELRTFSTCPVIIISAKDAVSIKIDLLKLGADDYVTKPFDLDELIARVETNIRRSQNTYDVRLLKYKDLTLNTETKRTAINEIEIDLTAKEYSILELLLTHNGKVFTKANLYESIWGEDYLGDDNAVKAHISNIRSKLKSANPHEEYIETVWGLGYRLYKG